MRRLRLPRRTRQWILALGVVAVAVPTAAHSEPKSAAKSVYEVRDGDTLNAIAKRFRIPLRALIDANHLEHLDLLHPGQRLVIPAGGQASATPVPSGRAVVRPVAPPNFFVLTPPDLDGRAPAFRWPLDGPISSPFGRRRSGWHAGIDIKADLGTPILAAAPGVVSFSGWDKAYGRVVRIAHDDGFVTVYAHNFQNFVKAGETVDAGQVIGTVGRTGRATAYHLHFEIWNQGKVFNPLVVLPKRDIQMAPESEGDQPEEGVEAP